MKKVIIIIIVILIVGGGIYLSKNKLVDSQQESVSQSILSASENSHDFGDIDIFSGKVTREFTLTNEGPDPITILAGTTSCGCTDGEIGGISFGMHEQMSKELTIEAGEGTILNVIYDPLAHGPSGTGKVIRQVFLKTNSTATPELGIKIMANVTKEVE